MSRMMLRGATVITMDAGRPDHEDIDVLIDDDVIAGAGPDLDPSGATVVDLSGRILIPGLVNAHLHTWQTALRGIGADWTLLQYLSNLHGHYGPRYQPDDTYIGNLAGALNQINLGTTTLGDWTHNNTTPEHTDAALAGLREAGVRATFLHGTPYGAPDVAHTVTEVDRLLGTGLGPLITIGMAIGGPQMSTPEVAVADLRAAAERGILASAHQSGGQPGPAWHAVRDAGVIGERTNIVHGAGLPPDWIAALSDAGASFTLTPENELTHGHGNPITAALIDHGAAPSLGTDSDTAVPGDVLTSARIALIHHRAVAHHRARQQTGSMSQVNAVSSKQALAWATVEGARALGHHDRIGRITAGLQADLVAIDARHLNLWPVHDPVAAALQANVVNIEAVMIAGTWRKRDHRLLDVDLAKVTGDLTSSSQRLVKDNGAPCR